MKISIITATWNSEATVRDTFESVLHQTFQDIEYIIIDGQSTDNTLQIIKEYEPKFNGKLHYISEPDKGIYDAMNKGLNMATGDIVGILNSDDFYYDSNVLMRIASAFSSNNIDCVYGDLQFVDRQDTNKVVRTWIGSQYKPKAFLRGWHPAHPTFYVKKECIHTLGGFDLSFDVSADFELMLRYIEKNQITSLYIHHYFVKMRMGGESTGSISSIIKGNKNILRAFEKNGFKIPPFYLLRRLAPKVKNLIKTKINPYI